MTGLMMYGVPERQAEAHRRTLRALRAELAPHGLYGRMVERLYLHMHWGPHQAILRPPELDVYGDGRLVTTVTVVDVPGGGGAWYLTRRPDGLPTKTHPARDPSATARAIAANRDRAVP
ncbi:hypothetical protein Ssi03_36380 [Sphaerisporangium siamense]|uniref:Uncharacterized protein n=1 Tax=Sphaerisporangium siamense TaxID=795645 RepID=A0A7W7D9Y8_9ACTN|nr:hypothetical protein [Sphaerisporangium siamense]MBB4701523.1 hypothetical protein [Sphaerisporangium siamense]GII85648.1 hypothetical protein Ssi03_36380 [Sphaerisporangium siamense]